MFGDCQARAALMLASCSLPLGGQSCPVLMGLGRLRVPMIEPMPAIGVDKARVVLVLVAVIGGVVWGRVFPAGFEGLADCA